MKYNSASSKIYDIIGHLGSKQLEVYFIDLIGITYTANVMYMTKGEIYVPAIYNTKETIYDAVFTEIIKNGN